MLSKNFKKKNADVFFIIFNLMMYPFLENSTTLITTTNFCSCLTPCCCASNLQFALLILFFQRMDFVE